jgi:hypothetical protein
MVRGEEEREDVWGEARHHQLRLRLVRDGNGGHRVQARQTRSGPWPAQVQFDSVR